MPCHRPTVKCSTDAFSHSSHPGTSQSPPSGTRPSGQQGDAICMRLGMYVNRVPVPCGS
ncbi:hypothetical protein ACRRTK_023205 [Alexandromys fortis]